MTTHYELPELDELHSWNNTHFSSFPLHGFQILRKCDSMIAFSVRDQIEDFVEQYKRHLSRSFTELHEKYRLADFVLGRGLSFRSIEDITKNPKGYWCALENVTMPEHWVHIGYDSGYGIILDLLDGSIHAYCEQPYYTSNEPDAQWCKYPYVRLADNFGVYFRASLVAERTRQMLIFTPMDLPDQEDCDPYMLANANRNYIKNATDNIYYAVGGEKNYYEYWQIATGYTFGLWQFSRDCRYYLAGVPRNRNTYWAMWWHMEQEREIPSLSDYNIGRIMMGIPPVVDEQWVQVFPETKAVLEYVHSSESGLILEPIYSDSESLVFAFPRSDYLSRFAAYAKEFYVMPKKLAQELENPFELPALETYSNIHLNTQDERLQVEARLQAVEANIGISLPEQFKTLHLQYNLEGLQVAEDATLRSLTELNEDKHSGWTFEENAEEAFAYMIWLAKFSHINTNYVLNIEDGAIYYFYSPSPEETNIDEVSHWCPRWSYNYPFVRIANNWESFLKGILYARQLQQDNSLTLDTLKASTRALWTAVGGKNMYSGFWHEATGLMSALQSS